MRQKLARREQFLLFVLGVLIVTYLYWLYLLQPQLTARNNVLSELETANELLKKGQNIAESLPRAEQAQEDVKKQLSKVMPKFSNEMQDGAVLVDIGLTAVKQGVDVTLVRPARVVDKKYYLELPFEFQVRGDYPQVMQFISKIENLANISEIRKLDIMTEALAEDEGASPLAAYGRVVADFIPVIYAAPTPQNKIQLEALAKWELHRPNMFDVQTTESPYPGIEPPPKGPFTGPGTGSLIGIGQETGMGTGFEPVPEQGVEPGMDTGFPGTEPGADAGLQGNEPEPDAGLPATEPDTNAGL
ncbi:MAG: type 4a pilus biogenesis protein PilO [Bacillota bacterium]